MFSGNFVNQCVFLLHYAPVVLVDALDENDYSAAGHFACIGCGEVGKSWL
jgi:hypothetical protein